MLTAWMITSGLYRPRYSRPLGIKTVQRKDHQADQRQQPGAVMIDVPVIPQGLLVINIRLRENRQ